MQALWTFITHDWYFFIPLFLMSLTGLTLIIWRLLLNINGNTTMSAFLPEFQEKLERDGVEGACASAAVARTSSRAVSLSPAWKRPSRDWRRCGARWPTSSNWRSCRT